MEAEKLLRITDKVAIPLTELRFRFSRSGGPGGQNVNRVETRVELLFDVLHSPSLNDLEKAQVLDRLRGHIDKEGVLHLIARASRSQLQNRAEAVGRFGELLARALRPRRARRPTRPGPAAHERRLRAKRGRSERKRERERPTVRED
ncbi:MAG: aminoacyl-tRNA hydrolase [Candidatus Acetothermia bacterium]|jgi:ribosome-associated protein|nr:aminoacyl-tRNA hydrolase [Candidatus Acetothermia bacterium]MDH7505001.1 alternative ribosome rescue aminoacyl-tRNA hydrolase ArfB [Candidatus Acetothermia bacterium]